jgi:hypothetical protein
MAQHSERNDATDDTAFGPISTPEHCLVIGDQEFPASAFADLDLLPQFVILRLLLLILRFQ